MTPSVHHLTSGGTSVVVEFSDHRLPSILHWGAQLDLSTTADLDAFLATASPAVNRSAFDAPRRVSVTPLAEEGWAGTPGLSAAADDNWLTGFRTTTAELDEQSATFTIVDDAGVMSLSVGLHLSPDGMLRLTSSVANLSDRRLVISDLRGMLPLPRRASEVLSLTGRWSLERQPQRQPLAFGTLLRATRRGRPGHDSPLVLVAGTAGFGWRSGEVWATHIAWSGDAEYLAERLPEGAGVHDSLLGGGMSLSGEPLSLAPGASQTAPDAYFAYSANGLDGLATAFHGTARALQPASRRPRPVLLNTWEATYFDLNAATLRDLADRAASLGVERLVVDDGWFRHRRDDTAGLGDWYVDDTVWHGELVSVSEYIRAHGMEFGLWFEPEMVTPDSDLARTHSDWVLGNTGTWRHQQALDLSLPEVRDYLVERLRALVDELGIAYIKWDHNREVAHPRSSQGHRVGREQTWGLYDVLERVRGHHPDLEIESCASGGARVDFGMVPHVQRFWASDTNDPVERQTIQRWTQLLVPPEMLGSHLGPTTAHTSERTTSLSFRLVTAFFGHMGIEWDIREFDDATHHRVKNWISEHRRLRPLLHNGTVVNADLVDGQMLHGVVADDSTHAVFAWVRLTSAVGSATERIRFPGLDRHRRYRVRRLLADDEVTGPVVSQPPWFVQAEADGFVEVSGEILTVSGIPLPMLHPAAGILLELTATEN